MLLRTQAENAIKPQKAMLSTSGRESYKAPDRETLRRCILCDDVACKRNRRTFSELVMLSYTHGRTEKRYMTTARSRPVNIPSSTKIAHSPTKKQKHRNKDSKRSGHKSRQTENANGTNKLHTNRGNSLLIRVGSRATAVLRGKRPRTQTEGDSKLNRVTRFSTSIHTKGEEG